MRITCQYGFFLLVLICILVSPVAARPVNTTLNSTGVATLLTPLHLPDGVLTSLCPVLPAPDVSYSGSEQYTGSDGNQYIRYDLVVTNRADYSDDLFVSAPDLPPCGLNPASSRTWVDIYDSAGPYIYGFCSLTDSDDLGTLWFGIPEGEAAPGSVIIQIKDRRCNQFVRSLPVRIPPVVGISPTPVETGTPTPTPTVPVVSGRASVCPNISMSYEENTDRPGQDMRNVNLETEDPCACALLCQSDPECQAFTYVRAGVQGPTANCWLKNGAPDPIPSDIGISGVRTGVRAPSVVTSTYTPTPTPTPAGTGADGCPGTLISPVVSYTGMSEYSNAEGDWVQYTLRVVNLADYPARLFVPDSDLPPCGSNPSASRTWVNIFSRDGTYLYGYCAISSPDDLAEISFALHAGAAPPAEVTVEFNDRTCSLTALSAAVPITGSPGGPGPSGLPAPVQISPEDGSVFSSYPRDTTMKWRPVIGAASYTLEIDCFNCCVNGQWCTDTGSEYQVKPGLTETEGSITFVGKQKGRWRISAVDAEGNEGEKSPWWEFEYTV